MIPLIVIEGPTASGKSALALELAEAIGGEIISADSRQIYRLLNIGTAKPSTRDLERIPHHLIDIIYPNESFNAGRFAGLAHEAIRDVHRNGHMPILCGGTGLYVRSVLEGLCPMPEISPDVKSLLLTRLKVEGLNALFIELQKFDPSFAEKVSQNDKQRIIRGLEVFYGTGMNLTDHWVRQLRTNHYQVFRILINPPRDRLYHRINQRIKNMLESGLLDEISGILNGGYTWSDPGLNSLGYKEYMDYYMQKRSLDECSLLAAQYSRNYAKRQLTWYRSIMFDLTLTADELNISSTIKHIKTTCKSLLCTKEDLNVSDS